MSDHACKCAGCTKAKASERKKVIAFLEDLAKDPSGINLQGAIAQLKEKKD